MNLFYTPDLQVETYILNEEESRHCIRVLRLVPNDVIYLTDGKGNLYQASIADNNLKACQVKILQTFREYEKRDFYLHIAIAPTKNIDRFEWFLEKATEIGIDEITPLLCNHSERTVIKNERLEKVIVSAMKQSLKAYKPKLNNLTKFNDLVNQPFDGIKYIAHCEEGSKLPLKSDYSKKQNVLILIGPEGDFSPAEIETARKCGFKEITLGKSRLRTETAGIVACHSIHLLNE